MRRNWSGRSMAPTHEATQVTSGVVSTQPAIATAKIIRYRLEIISRAVFRDSCGCNPIPRIRLRQEHPGCRSMSRFDHPVKADSPESSGERRKLAVRRGSQGYSRVRCATLPGLTPLFHRRRSGNRKIGGMW